MNENELLLYNSLKGLHLLGSAPKMEILRDLMGLQAQFARNPQISLSLRASDYTPDTWQDGLVKTWSHRGTIHVIPEEELSIHLSAAGHTHDEPERWWGFDKEDMKRWAPFILSEVRRGNADREGLKQACLNEGMSDELLRRIFHGWGGLIKEMCWRGQLAVCPGMEKAYLIPKGVKFIDRDEARLIFLRRYFERFGPATWEDCRHFFGGWKAAETRPLFARLLPELMASQFGGKTYYHMRPLVKEADLPECALVPGFDQLSLGYRDRGRMIEEKHIRRLVNGAGIVFPVVILRGKMRASWKKEGDDIIVTPFERLLRKDEAAVRRAVREKLHAGVRQVIFASE